MRSLKGTIITLSFPVILLIVMCAVSPSFGHEGEYSLSFQDDIVITSFDGLELLASIYVPVSLKAFPEALLPDGVTFPAIIFSHGMGQDKDGSTNGAVSLAENGYVVLRFSARGTQESGGEADCFGEETIRDFSAVIDWLVAHPRVDAGRIGAAGLSQGGAVSFIGSAHDKRIKAIGMMSMGFNLAEALYGANTTRRTIIEILLMTVDMAGGKFSPEIRNLFFELILNDNYELADELFASRSPSSYIDIINARNLPVFISLNTQDSLYWMNQGLDYFPQITAPKFMMFSDGSHASAEYDDTLGPVIWGNLLKWFDQFLKEENTGIADGDLVNMQVTGTDGRISFDTWPPTENSKNQIEVETLYLHPRTLLGYGGMNRNSDASSRSDIILSEALLGLTSSATTKIPMVGGMLDFYETSDHKVWIPGVNGMAAVVYQSKPFDQDRVLVGVPKLSLSVESIISDVQLIAHLYDVNSLGIGTLMTYAPIHVSGLRLGAAESITMAFAGISYPMKKGHRLALIIDTKDLQFDPLFSWPYPLIFHYERTPEFSIPFLANEE